MLKKILVVDDDVSFRSKLTSVIEGWGYEVIQARNGTVAYEIFSDKPEAFFAVVSDMRMPGGSGPVFCQAMDRCSVSVPTLMHSTESGYIGFGVDYMDISELKKYFDFVKVTHLKPKLNNDFGYVKKFLDSIAA